jgi:hypothetical protein
MIELILEEQDQLEFESYPLAHQIDGVWLNPLRKNLGEDSWDMPDSVKKSSKTSSVLEIKQVNPASVYAD